MLKDSKKWRVRDKEAPPKKGSLVKLEDEDDDTDDALRGGRSKGKLEGNKKEKARVKMTVETTTLREQIGDMAKIKETMLSKH